MSVIHDCQCHVLRRLVEAVVRREWEVEGLKSSLMLMDSFLNDVVWAFGGSCSRASISLETKPFHSKSCDAAAIQKVHYHRCKKRVLKTRSVEMQSIVLASPLTDNQILTLFHGVSCWQPL